jgi:hypothetical protein
MRGTEPQPTGAGRPGRYGFVNWSFESQFHVIETLDERGSMCNFGNAYYYINDILNHKEEWFCLDLDDLTRPCLGSA